MRDRKFRRGRDRNPEYIRTEEGPGAWQEDPEGFSYAWDGADPWADGGQAADSVGWNGYDPEPYGNSSDWEGGDSWQDESGPPADDGFEFMDLDDSWGPAAEPAGGSQPIVRNKRGGAHPAAHDKQGRLRGSSPEKKVKIQHMIILIGLIVIFVVSGSFFISDLREYKTAENEYEKITESTIKLPDSNTKPARVEVDGEEYDIPFEFPNLVIDFDKLEAANADFVGVLHIPALELTYPVAHSKDNSEYLSRTFEGTRNASGCIFMDMYAKEDLTDSNTFIFGHNMKNQSMFGSLKRFSSDKGLCDKHPYIYLFTPGKVYRYRIFSYFPTPVDSYIYNGYTGEEGYDAYIQKSLRDSQYKEADLSEIDFKEYPNLLTLSTCFGTQHTHNFIVQGALVETLDLPGSAAGGASASEESAGSGE